VYTWSGIGETYILENFGPYNPCSQGTHIGTLNSDGGTYDVCHVSRSATYQQFWSVRQSKRSSGTVTTANHYNYYNAHGLSFNPATNATYQIVSTEGFGSQGSASITVGSTDSTSPSPPPPATSSSSPSPPPPSNPSPPPPSTGGNGGGGSCSALYGQCGGIGWAGATCCSQGSCKVGNPYYSQCLN
jgi:endo-1,4-beta-xylanase